MKCQRELYKKNKINNKVAINSQLSIIVFKKQISKQLEQEQNHRNGDHMEGYWLGAGMGRMVEKVQGIRSANCSYRMGRGRSRTV